jgi:hypothetical protein
MYLCHLNFKSVLSVWILLGSGEVRTVSYLPLGRCVHWTALQRVGSLASMAIGVNVGGLGTAE